MKTTLLLCLFATLGFAQPPPRASGVVVVFSTPSGQCLPGSPLRYYAATNSLYGCVLPSVTSLTGTWQSTGGTIPTGVNPGGCTVGQLFFDITAAPGQNLLACTAPDTWTMIGASGGDLVDPGSNGVVVRTALNTTVARTIAGTAGRISVTNGSGVGGDPTLDLATAFDISGSTSTKSVKIGTTAPATCGVGELFFDSDATAGQNLYACTAANTWTLLGDGGGGATGIIDPGSNGILARTALNTVSARTITGTSNKITVTNGTGASGDPTLTLADAFDISGNTSTKPVKTGTSPPATCAVGELFYDTDASAGLNLYACTATNTWTLLGDGAGSVGTGHVWFPLGTFTSAACSLTNLAAWSGGPNLSTITLINAGCASVVTYELPAAWDSSAVTIEALVTINTTSTNVFTLIPYGVCYDPESTVYPAMTTPGTGVNTTPNGTSLVVYSVTMTVPTSGCNPGDQINIAVARDSGDAYASDVFLLGAKVSLVGAGGGGGGGGAGTVTSVGLSSNLGTVTNSPVTGMGTLTLAVSAAQIVAKFTGCTGVKYLAADANCYDPAGGGTVTSVAFSSDLGTVTGSPVTGTGTLALTISVAQLIAKFSGCGAGTNYLGDDGACHAAAGAGTVTNASALTANLPVIGAGGNAVAVGTRTGNTTLFATSTGAQTSGRCVEIDASGNHIAAAAACGTDDLTIGATAIVSGTTTRILYDNAGTLGEYAISGTGSVVMTSRSISTTSPLGGGGDLSADRTLTCTTCTTNASALTSGLPMIGGGSNAAAVGTRTGNTTLFATSTGTQTSGRCVEIDSNGNHIAAAVVCGGTGASITSGTYASLPATCATSDLYFTTDSYYNVFRCTSTNTWRPFVDGWMATIPGVCAGWTVVNGASGTATCTNSAGAPTLTATTGVAGFEAALKAIPAAPYTKTFVLSQRLVNTTGNAGACGVGWSTGTATTSDIHVLLYFVWGTYVNISPVVASYTDFAWGGASTNYSAIASDLPSRFKYAQLEDNSTDRIVRVSNDKRNWIEIYRGARTTPFTPTHYMFGCGEQGSPGTDPWSVSLVSEE